MYNINVTYHVNDITWNGNSGQTTVTVTTPNLEIIFSDSISDAINICGTDDYAKLLEKTKANILDTLQEKDCPMVSYEIDMETTKTNEGYILINNNEFQKIIDGNVEEIFLKTLAGGNVQ